jgi:catechol 2,3-dioxygenase-like lactoylglutathione lyase family enzyme
MKLRVARHTNNLDVIITFYKDILGFKVLGNFAAHNGYDGVFLGLPNTGWHLEFTVSDEAPIHYTDDDDLLVFYAESDEHYNKLLQNFSENRLLPVIPKNPYWQLNGTTYADPDGYRIIIAKALLPQS